MKRADKYPLIDPRLPRLYSRIIEAANQLRASRSIDNSIHHAEVRAARIESLQPWALREAALEAELLAPALPPSPVTSGPELAVSASAD
jgi:hypothetical protein